MLTIQTSRGTLKNIYFSRQFCESLVIFSDMQGSPTENPFYEADYGGKLSFFQVQIHCVWGKRDSDESFKQIR